MSYVPTVDMFAAIMGTPYQVVPFLNVLLTSRETSFLDFTLLFLGTIRTSE
jgi:hypothetical protein